MTERSIENATVQSTSLGPEDHGIMSAYLTLSGDGWGQSFGGYALTGGDAMHLFVKGVLDVLELDRWEKVKGQLLRADHDWGKVYRIGHPIKNKWFDPPATFAAARLRAEGAP